MGFTNYIWKQKNPKNMNEILGSENRLQFKTQCAIGIQHWNKVVCIAPPAPTEKMSKNTEADASYDQNIGSRQQAKYHNTRMWYLQGLSFSIWIKLKYSRFCMTALILAYYWGTRRNSFDWLAGPSSQLAGLLWTLSCAPASCPDVSFWTLVGFSWWWGEWAANWKLTSTGLIHW